MRVLLATSAFSLATIAQAQAIEIGTLAKADVTIYTVSGAFEPGDGERFTRVATADKAVVSLVSPGGNLLAGIAMGEHIRLKGYLTTVPSGGTCASACALAWLGGVTRGGGETSKIGFHAASTRGGEVTSSGNALVGAYLNKIGVSYKAIQYITAPQPSDMTWLSFSKARELGIEIVALDAPRGSEPTGLGGAPSSGRAQTQAQTNATADIRLICAPLSREGRDPVAAINVSRIDNFWRIVHIAASGAQYDRGEQYEISREPGAPSGRAPSPQGRRVDPRRNLPAVRENLLQ
ncbi:MAG: hypothetical protein HZY79_07815 [Rhodoblastus sp.]|nr:MAG: hypothetical protein HZY79_07815 [Rhodoblastus sp.]